MVGRAFREGNMVGVSPLVASNTSTKHS